MPSPQTHDAACADAGEVANFRIANPRLRWPRWGLTNVQRVATPRPPARVGPSTLWARGKRPGVVDNALLYTTRWRHPGCCWPRRLPCEPTRTFHLSSTKSRRNGDSCRLHFLLTNETDTAFSSFRIQIAFFDRSGGFVNSAAADFLKVRPRKTILRFFDVPTLRCAEIGKVLLNDAAACDAEDGPVADCVEMIAPTHRTEMRFYK